MMSDRAKVVIARSEATRRSRSRSAPDDPWIAHMGFSASRAVTSGGSPAPGDKDVISQVARLSSNETKIAPSCERIAAVSVKERSSDIGRLQDGGSAIPV